MSHEIKEGLKYTKDHEWVRITEDNIAYVGITDFAQSELGELVYIEVDTIGDSLEEGEVFGTIEAVKTTSDLFMPITGEILEFNPAIDEDEGDNPAVINSSPYGDGWIIKIAISDLSDMDSLLDAEAYKALVS